jgi:hypothetical protein
MAITNAQQYQQLVNKPANGKRPGYRGDAAYGKDSGSAQSRSIGQARGQTGPGRSNEAMGDGPASKGFDQDAAPGGQDPSVYGVTGKQYDPDAALAAAKAQGKFDKPNAVENFFKPRRKTIYNIFPNNPKNELAYLRSLPASQRALLSPALRAKLEAIDDEATFDDYTTAGQKFSFEEFEDLRNFTPTEGLNFADYAAKYLGAPGLKYSGNVGNLEKYVTKRGPDGRPLEYGYREKIGDGGGDNTISKILPEDTMGDTKEDEVNPRDYTGLAPRFMGSIFDFSGPQFAADGGIMRAGAMDGGRMRQMEMMEDEDDPTGGIMDLESGRQMYFLGKLVKKAGRAIKKVAKSPIGKAALLYFGGNALMSGGGGGLSSFFGKGSFNPFLKKVAGDTAFSKLGNIASKFGMVDSKGAMTLGGKLGLSFGVPFALDALGVGKEENDDDAYKKYMEEMRLNVPATRARRNLAAAFDGSTYNYEAYADGGRTGYQEGGDAEPVAKKTMPLLDMNGMEKDYREDGGFVPIGRMERADDVPARLSKNEFVFTADAVRNAGEGDIDKGAEVMYNMMKNLESGGEVSEESQGLDGAREMFQTSKRLEEVL